MQNFVLWVQAPLKRNNDFESNGPPVNKNRLRWGYVLFMIYSKHSNMEHYLASCCMTCMADSGMSTPRRDNHFASWINSNTLQMEAKLVLNGENKQLRGCKLIN